MMSRLGKGRGARRALPMLPSLGRWHRQITSLVDESKALVQPSRLVSTFLAVRFTAPAAFLAARFEASAE